MGVKYEAEQLVFVIESLFDRRTSYRGRAWALKGVRAIRKCFFIRGKRYVLRDFLRDFYLIIIGIPSCLHSP